MLTERMSFAQTTLPESCGCIRVVVCVGSVFIPLLDERALEMGYLILVVCEIDTYIVVETLSYTVLPVYSEFDSLVPDAAQILRYSGY